jgi:hypothetical protein
MEAELFRIPADASLTSPTAIRQEMAKAKQADATLDLGEAWPGLHVVMSGEMPIPKYEATKRGIEWFDDSLENVLLGGDPLPLRLAFGPVGHLPAAKVAGLAALLEALSPKEFADRYDPMQLDDDEIPPGGWDSDHRKWLSSYYEKLREFFLDAAHARQAVLIAID